MIRIDGPGPRPTPVLSAIVACAARGELGRLLSVRGRGGGSIWVDVRLEAECEEDEGLVDCEL